MSGKASQTVSGKPHFGYLIFIYALTGLFLAVFGTVYDGAPLVQTGVIYALLLNFYIALALWVVTQRSGNFGLAIFLALTPIGLALLLKIQLLLIAITLIYLFLLTRRLRPLPEKWRFNGFYVAGLVIIALAFAVVILGSPKPFDILFHSKLIAGKFDTDPIFHSAVAAMIKNFDVSSIGAHGVTPLKYHALSHYLYAAFAYITGLSLTAAYSSSYTIVFLPLLLISIAGAAENISPARSSSEHVIRLMGLLFLLLGFVGFEPGTLSHPYGLWISFFQSESYTLSLILLLALISAMTIDKLGLQVFLAFVLITFIAFAKISTGVIACVMYVAHLVFCCQKQWRTRLLGVFIITASVTLILWLQASGSSAVSIDYFHFLKTYLGGPDKEIYANTSIKEFPFWWILAKFILAHFIFSWICFGLTLTSNFSDQAQPLQRWNIWIYNLVGLGIGITIISFISLPGGAVYYFSNVAMFIALPYIVVIAGNSNNRLLTKSSVHWKKLAIPTTIFALGIFGVYGNATYFKNDMIRKLHNNVIVKPSEVWIGYSSQFKAIREAANTNKLLVYVAKENQDFWDNTNRISRCFAPSFAIAALSERPAIFGLPDKAKCDVEYYGFDDYPEELFARSARPRIPHEELLLEAKRLGFDGYIDVTQSTWKSYYWTH